MAPSNDSVLVEVSNDFRLRHECLNEGLVRDAVVRTWFYGSVVSSNHSRVRTLHENGVIWSLLEPFEWARLPKRFLLIRVVQDRKRFGILKKLEVWGLCDSEEEAHLQIEAMGLV